MYIAFYEQGKMRHGTSKFRASTPACGSAMTDADDRTVKSWN
jgi:hypothetical protein